MPTLKRHLLDKWNEMGQTDGGGGEELLQTWTWQMNFRIDPRNGERDSLETNRYVCTFSQPFWNGIEIKEAVRPF